MDTDIFVRLLHKSHKGVFTTSITIAAFMFGACEKDVAVTGISLNKTSLDLAVGLSARIEAKVTPDNATDTTVVWQSSTPDVVSVDDAGTITALTTGSAVITATTVGVRKTAFCKVKAVPFMETVLVEGGTFNMGATPEQGDDAFENEKPVHQVTLNDFRMGIFEVTQKQWYDIMRDWNSEPPTAEYGAGDNYPMYNVSWNDIQQFIAALNAVYPDKHYRLPTEAEWEYAARGGNVSIRRSVFYKYSGSNDIDEVAWYSGNNVPDGNKPVGSKQPNELGIYDLCGNVYELCADRYGEYAPDPQIDPQGPDSGQLYVYRGGYWDANPNFCRVSYRYNIAPDFAYNCFGFRLVCD